MTELTGEARVLDVLGNPVGIGDVVAGAFRVGNSAQLRVGTVLGFGERANNVTVRVKWRVSSGYGRGAREVDIEGAIEADLVRFVRISA